MTGQALPSPARTPSPVVALAHAHSHWSGVSSSATTFAGPLRVHHIFLLFLSMTCAGNEALCPYFPAQELLMCLVSKIDSALVQVPGLVLELHSPPLGTDALLSFQPSATVPETILIPCVGFHAHTCPLWAGIISSSSRPYSSPGSPAGACPA